MKTKSKISGHIVRSITYAVFLAVAFIAASWAFDSPNKWYKSAMATVGYDTMAKSRSQPRAFSFADRVVFQRAIENVYWRHRIWPGNRGENADPKPSLDAVMSQAQLEKKVAGYLHDSVVLQDYWQWPITAAQLQAEMDRMARDTKQPEVLREAFEALGSDPAVIAECLARPILAERLIADLSAQDQTRHIESPQTEVLRAMSLPTTLGQIVYTLPEIAEACTDQWGATSTSNAPSARYDHTAVWTGSEMIVWGGDSVDSFYRGLNTGGRYNPNTNTWTATSTVNAPSGRTNHTAIWTGSEMIVWGGFDPGNGGYFNTGGRYNPSTDSWTATSTTDAPTGRYDHTAVWTGSEMIVWGGGLSLNTGGRYDPGTDSWTATSITYAPTGRGHHTAVWTGNEMIVWGGADPNRVNTGGRYCGGPYPTPTPTPRLGPPNDDFADAIVISTTSGSLVGTNTHSTTQVGEPAGENSVWYRWVPASTGDAQFHIGMDWLKITIYTGAAIDALTQVAVSSGTPSSVHWTAVAGTTYQIRLTKNTRTSDFTLFWSLIVRPPNDAFASAILLSGANGTVTGTNVNATDQSASGEPTGDNSVWYRWTALTNGTAHFNIGMDWLTIDVYTGTTIGGLTRVATSSGSPSAVTWTAMEGTTYRIRLTKNTRTADFHLLWTF